MAKASKRLALQVEPSFYRDLVEAATSRGQTTAGYARSILVEAVTADFVNRIAKEVDRGLRLQPEDLLRLDAAAQALGVDLAKE